jgi:hypothetical protein
MLFSSEPKTRREDLYDLDRELSRLIAALRDKKPTLITSLRRTDDHVQALPQKARVLRYTTVSVDRSLQGYCTVSA